MSGAPVPRMHGAVHVPGGPDPTWIGWEDVEDGGGTGAILGNSVDHSSGFSDGAGGKFSYKFNLPAAGTLTELHAWVNAYTPGNSYVIHVYADSGGEPGAPLVYTSAIVVPPGGTTDVEISQAGFSVALAAGDYWIGVTSQASTNQIKSAATGATPYRHYNGAAFHPPSNPWGTSTDTGTATPIAAWAVV